MINKVKKRQVNKDKNKSIIKTDLSRLRRDLLNELDGLEYRLDRRFQDIVTLIKQEGKETRDHVQALVEEVREDVGGANKEEVGLIKNQKIPELEERVTVLEQRAGVA